MTGSHRFLVIAVLLAVGTSATRVEAQSGEPFAFKGVPLGASEQQLLERFPAFECRDDRDKLLADRVCLAGSGTCAGRGAREPLCQTNLNEILSYGGAPASFVMARFYDGRFAGVLLTVREDDFSRISAALTEAYGKPANIATEAFQNRAGATFQSMTVIWRRAGSSIKIDQRQSRVDTGGVNISLDSTTPEFNRRKALQRKSDGKDL